MKKFKVRTYIVKTDNKAGILKKPVRLVVLADLHCAQYGQGNSILIQEVYASKPDMIMVVGDMLVSKPDKPVNTDITLSLMKEFVNHYPVFYCNGNHEYRTKIYPETYGNVYEGFKKKLKNSGVFLLENEKFKFERAGGTFFIHGYELDKVYFKRFSRAQLPVEEMNEVLGVPEEEGYHILLAHNPVFFKTYAKWGADLTLSGHLHGGMVRLPILGGVISPQVQLFPKYDRGLFHIGDRKIIVSAGLGSHSVKLRINNPPELVVVELQ